MWIGSILHLYSMVWEVLAFLHGSCPMILALGLSLGISTAVSLRQSIRDRPRPEDSLFSWLDKPANMKAGLGWLDTGPRSIFSRWSFHHKTMLSPLSHKCQV
jgi:hypothetical protein